MVQFNQRGEVIRGGAPPGTPSGSSTKGSNSGGGCGCLILLFIIWAVIAAATR